MKPMLRLLTCATHGDRRWQGHVVCDGCGRVYQTASAGQPRHAPATCPCGAALMPSEREQVGDPLGLTIGGAGLVVDNETGEVVESFSTYDSRDWTARPICYLCYRVITKKFGGTIPRYAEQRAERDGRTR
jgi:hypothetical protein